MKLPSHFPLVIKKAGVTVKIYRTANAKNGTTYDEFRVAYYAADGKRKIKAFFDFAEAHSYASNVTASYRRGDMHALSLTNEDKLVYERALKSVEVLKVPLDAAAAEYAEAKQILGKLSLKDAAQFFVTSCAHVQRSSVRNVVDKLIESRRNPTNKSRSASIVYLKDLESRLGRFADAFRCDMCDLGANDIQIFLASIKGSSRTWFNYARLLKTLFKFAQTHRFYPRNVDPFEAIDVNYEDDGDIEIFTPVELSRILAAARPEVLPFLVIGAFAGLRHAEICRLDWSDIKTDHIEVKKSKAKTRSRRLVPLQQNLTEWLAPLRRADGPVITIADVTRPILKAAAATGPLKGPDAANRVQWKHNGLRHSFISYRLAVTQNENVVAMEAGNSPQMIYAHYRQLVTLDDAKAWFSIVPHTPANVVPVPVQPVRQSVQIAP